MVVNPATAKNHAEHDGQEHAPMLTVLGRTATLDALEVVVSAPSRRLGTEKPPTKATAYK